MNSTANKHKTLLDKPLIPSIIFFAIPVILTSWLQLLFNAADLVVVGKFAENSANAQAAIGSTVQLINLIINLFLGFSVGVNVVVANSFGANDKNRMSNSVRTSMILSLILGLVVMVIGLVFSTPMLKLMNTNKEVLNSASQYLRIYFIGAPFMLIYNFGSSVLRSVGDTKRPMIFLSISGIANVLLNLFAVAVLNMGVLGVALATTVSNIISSILIVISLMRTKGMHKLVLKEFFINTSILKQIIKIGLPSGINAITFSLSNVIIQSAFNSFNNPLFIAGNSNANNLENFLFMINNGFYQAAITFTSQSVGAGKPYLIKKIYLRCTALVTGILIPAGLLFAIFSPSLASIYSSNTEVIQYTINRMSIICIFAFLGGLHDVSCGTLRGMGNSLQPMIVSIFCICGFRILWIYTVFQKYHYAKTLYASYPITWAISLVGLCILLVTTYRRLIRQSPSQLCKEKNL